jgi:hypothetical protein
LLLLLSNEAVGAVGLVRRLVGIVRGKGRRRRRSREGSGRLLRGRRRGGEGEMVCVVVGNCGRGWRCKV